MKRTYVRPTMVGERFVANEYVAACGEENKVYKFNCNAPRGQLYYYPSSDGTIDGKYTGTARARWVGDYHPCDAKHEASTTGDFHDGFVDYNKNRIQDEGEGVIVWLEKKKWGFVSGHATTNLNMHSWETVKS